MKSWIIIFLWAICLTEVSSEVKKVHISPKRYFKEQMLLRLQAAGYSFSTQKVSFLLSYQIKIFFSIFQSCSLFQICEYLGECGVWTEWGAWSNCDCRRYGQVILAKTRKRNCKVEDEEVDNCAGSDTSIDTCGDVELCNADPKDLLDCLENNHTDEVIFVWI